MTFDLKTYADALAFARGLKIDAPDAAILISTRLNISRAALFAFGERGIDAIVADQIGADLTARATGVPVAYLCGVQEFYGLKLRVNPAVLIPRSDTETLVDTALAAFPRAQPVRVLDLGTGSGAIALALKSMRPNWQISATDLSSAALAVARDNAAALGLHVEFLRGSWFAPVCGVFDLIVSNPPYIEAADVHLRAGDLRFEPLSALAAGADGLADLRLIIRHAADFLAPNGWLMLEHGYAQGDLVQALIKQVGYVNVRSIKDLGDNDRVSIGQIGPQQGQPRACT
jgi:release factor glutamine methyltransferase